jgi:hypothetical protein
MRGVWGLMWAAGVGVAVICGCASAGPRDVRSAATATAIITTTDLLIDTIDGTNMRQGIDGAPTRFVVAPGRHQLGVSRHFRPGRIRIRSEYATACIDTAAGHRYTLGPVFQADGSWTTALADATTGAPLPTTCEPPSTPVIAQDGVADGTTPAPDVAAAGAAVLPPAPAITAAPAAAPTEGVEDRRPDRPGSGFVVRAGVGAGGDTLVRVTFDNGEQRDLHAGGGLMFAVGGTLTPLWLRKNFGFGVGLELGWKYDSIGVANGSAAFSRYPLVATAHLFARMGRRWYFKLAGGLEKPLDPHYSGDGIFGPAEIDLQGRTGPLAEIGFYRLVRRHGAFDFSMRLSRPRYVVDGAGIDGSSLAIQIGGHYDL